MTRKWLYPAEEALLRAIAAGGGDGVHFEHGRFGRYATPGGRNFNRGTFSALAEAEYIGSTPTGKGATVTITPDGREYLGRLDAAE